MGKDIKLDKVYLFVTLALDEAIPSHRYTTFRKNATYRFHHTLLDNTIISYQDFLTLEPIIYNEFWKKNVESIVLYNLESSYNASFLTLCYILKPSVIDKFTSLDEAEKFSEIRKLLRFLIKDTMPDIYDLETILNKKNNEHGAVLRNYKLVVDDQGESEPKWFVLKKKYSLLDLYWICVPENNELTKYGKNESRSDFLRRFESKIKRDISRYFISPIAYIDFIETMPFYSGPSFGSQDQRVRLFLITNVSKDPSKVFIPISITELMAFDRKMYSLQKIKLASYHLYTNKGVKYIESITDVNFIKNYLQIFKNDRLEYLEYKFAVYSILTDYRNSVEKTIPYNAKENLHLFELKDINVNNDRPQYSSWRYLISEFERLVESIEQKMKYIESYDMYISSSIDSITSVMSVDSNDKLQKSVKRLTITAIIISLFACFTAVYSAETKNIVEDLLRKVQMIISTLWR
ncbi:MAG: hypothetical protein KF721_15795 [Ignavibacteriaceae bacterium]|nr:hypothetical protein [Ignavibacteriaceae bacterium]